MTATTPPTIQTDPAGDPYREAILAVLARLGDYDGFSLWLGQYPDDARAAMAGDLARALAAAMPVTGCPGTCLPEAGEYRREIAAKLAADVLAQQLTGTISPEAAGRAIVRTAQPIEAYLRGEQA